MQYVDLQSISSVWFFGPESEQMLVMAEILKRYGKQLYAVSQEPDALSQNDRALFSRVCTTTDRIRPLHSKVLVVVRLVDEYAVLTAEAKAAGATVVTYAQLLASFFYKKNSLATIGTFGKTSVAALLGYCLQQADYDPLVITDVFVQQFAGRALVGGSSYVVAELDEQPDLFTTVLPSAVLITNVDFDYPDVYASQEEYTQAFISLLRSLPEYGFVVANVDDRRVQDIITQISKKIITYGTVPSAEWRIELEERIGDTQRVSIHHHNNLWANVTVQLTDAYALSTVLGAVVAAVTLNVPQERIIAALSSFSFSQPTFKQNDSLFSETVCFTIKASHPLLVKEAIAAINQQTATKSTTLLFRYPTVPYMQLHKERLIQLCKYVDQVLFLLPENQMQYGQEFGALSQHPVITVTSEDELLKTVSSLPSSTALAVV